MLEGFDKAFENRVRLGLMSVLMTNDRLDFTELKGLLDVTDGNLASHITHLEKLNYIVIHKSFIGKKPNTSIQASKSGKQAFMNHLKALEKLLKKP